MAEKNQLKRVDPVDFGDDDPFAELTKIMGFDPRSPGRPSTPAVAEQPWTDAAEAEATADEVASDASGEEVHEMDFDIDLEKELLGDLSYGDDAAAEVTDFPVGDEVQPGETAAAGEPVVDEVVSAHDEGESAASIAEPVADELDVDGLGLDEAFDYVLAKSKLHLNENVAPDLAEVSGEAGVEPIAAVESAPAGDASTSEADDHATSDFDAELNDAFALQLDEELSLDAHEAVATDEVVRAEEPAARTGAEGTVRAEPDPADEDLVGDIDLDFTGEHDADEAPLSAAEPEADVEPAAGQEIEAGDPLLELADFARAHHNDADVKVEMAGDDVDMYAQAADGEEIAAAHGSFAQSAEMSAAAVNDIDAGFDATLADVDMDFNEDPYAEPYNAELSADEYEAEEPVAASMTPLAAMLYDVSHAGAEAPVTEEINLEDELSALLGDTLPRTQLDRGYDNSPLNLHTAQEPVSSYPPNSADEYGEEAAPAYATTVIDAYEEEPLTADAAYHTDEAYGEADAGYEAAAEGDLDLEFDDSHFQTAFDNSLDAHLDTEVGEAAAHDDDNPFDALHEMAAARQKADTARSRVFGLFSRSRESSGPAEGSHGEAPTARAAAPDMPEIETIEIQEADIVVTDDLDIPELDYQEEALSVAPYDEFESGFVSAYPDGALPAEPARPALAASGVAAMADFARSYPGAAHAEPDRRQSDNVAALTDDEAFADEFSADLFDALAADEEIAGAAALQNEQAALTDDELDPFQVTEVPAFVADRPERQGRGLLIAGVVLGVAALGGVGAFALSFGDQKGSTVPAVVKADADPIKIRPKNPGGVTVPNQDSKVYETVASGKKPSLPEQKTLITASEEPVDIAAQANEVRVVTPPTKVAEAADPIAEKITPKGEDRLPPSTEADNKPDNAEVAAVAPHRVRTMIVRSDGTLVPREDNEPDASSLAAEPEAGADARPIQPSKTAEAAADLPEATDMAETTGSTTQSPADNAKATEVISSPKAVSKVVPPKAQAMPATVAIAPSRPADQPVDIVGEVKPDKVAAISTSSAAVPGAWSVQIASQPSEEAAKASYQDLSRRYASVIGGKGVTIVKADIAGKGTYWRVRIPAGDRNSAISLCENYKSAGGNCFVSK